MILPKTIEGERICLVQMPESFLKNTWQDGVARSDDFTVHPDWFKEAMLAKMRFEQMQKDPSTASWLLRAIVTKSDGKMIGHFNCHDKPNSDFLQRYHSNAVEFGYTIYSEYRRQGYAREAVVTVMKYVRQHKLAEALVLAANITNFPSLQMIASLGFKEIDIVRDGEDIEKVFLLKL